MNEGEGTSRGTGTPQDGAPRDRDDRDPDRALSDTLAAMASQAESIQANLIRLVQVQFDRLQVALRTGAFRLVMGGLAGIVLLTATVVAVIYMVSGLTEGVALLFGGRRWAGDLVGGSFVLAVFFTSVAMAFRYWRKRHRKELESKYPPLEGGSVRPVRHGGASRR